MNSRKSHEISHLDVQDDEVHSGAELSNVEPSVLVHVCQVPDARQNLLVQSTLLEKVHHPIIRATQRPAHI